MSDIDIGKTMEQASDQKRLILFLGAHWWGSDSRALAAVLRRLGHAVVELNYEDFVPVHWSSVALRSVRKLLLSLFVRDYNRAIFLEHLGNPGFDFMLVFKGKHLFPATLERFTKSGLPAYCMYPDVSFLDHGADIWRCLPLYRCVFTTKSFHMKDAVVRQRVQELRLVSHGFDPDVHRPIKLFPRAQAAYACEVSFVGCWSVKKEKLLSALLQQRASVNLRIWGPGWERAGKSLQDRWEGRGAYGDELCLIYQASKVNLGLVSEAGGGTTVGDQVTARTWQIPAVGGFMLHEATPELAHYFAPGREVGVFSSPADLAERTSWYLANERERLEIAAAGRRRCMEEGYTYLQAARQILERHESQPRSVVNTKTVSAPRSASPGTVESGLRVPVTGPVGRDLESRLDILFVGPLVHGSTAVQRLEALRTLGHAVASVTTRNGGPYTGAEPPLLQRVEQKILGPSDQAGANQGILTKVREAPFDLVWIEKGLTITPEALRAIRSAQPACRIVGFSPDDMMNPGNQSRHFLRGLPLYDCYVTNKSFNVPELVALGCPWVVFMDNGFDPATHRPMELAGGDRDRFGGGVGFIGQWEPERAESLRALALAGLPVRVWGYTWERMKQVPQNLLLENRPFWGDDYAKAICAFDINLCFLRKCNRDRQTTRSIEIPACGAFMLAERTDEHLRLFEEGMEAEFFSSERELLDKVRYYLEHAEARKTIAAAGLRRCVSGAYSYPARLQKVLACLPKMG